MVVALICVVRLVGAAAGAVVTHDRCPPRVELLAGKKRLFDDFARVSDIADSTPEAVDLSEAELVRQIVAAERQRLAERATAES